MNPLVRWNPFNELATLPSQLQRLIDLDGSSRAAALTHAEAWTPAVDIVEDEKHYLFHAELPEVKKDDISVQIENGVLTLSGERRAEKDRQIRRIHRMERSYGTFVRSFELPGDVDVENVTATFKDGVLTVTVAKAESAQPRKIEVRIA